MEGEQFESTSTSIESPSVETSSYSEESSSESYEASSPNTDDTSSSGNSTISARSDEGTTFELFTDPATGKVEFRARTESPEEEEGQTEEESSEVSSEEDYQEEEQTQEEIQNTAEEFYKPSEKPQEYTLEEFTYAMANGIVDSSRVPQEYQSQYANFKIDQARAAYNQRLADEQYQRQLLEQQMQVEASPEARIQANKNFYENLEQEANRFAMQDLGLTPDAVEDLEYVDGGEQIKANLENAKNWHKQRLMGELQSRYQAEQQYKAGQRQLYAEIGEFTKQAQMNEPHFQEIDKMLATAWQEMPTKYGAIVQDALSALAAGTITRQQAQVVQKYYEDTRKMFYAKQNGLSTKPKATPKKKPPVVEGAGNGRDKSAAAPDYAALRNADARGKKAWLADFFKGIEL